MRRQAILMVTMAVLLAGCAAEPTRKPEAQSSTPTLEDLLAKLAKSDVDVKTLEFDIKIFATAAPEETTMAGHMAWQTVTKDGKTTEMMNMKSDKVMGLKSMLTVCDGVFYWIEVTDYDMGVRVFKSLAPASLSKQTNDWRQFREEYDLKLVGDEEFDGLKMWVLEGTLKAQASTTGSDSGAPGAAIEKIRISIGQQDDYLHRLRFYDKTGKDVGAMQVTGVKINAPLAPALFKYTPPAGAKIEDMSKGGPDADSATKDKPKVN